MTNIGRKHSLLYRFAVVLVITMWFLVFLSLSGCSTEQLDRQIEEQKKALEINKVVVQRLEKEIIDTRSAKGELELELQQLRNEAKDTVLVEARLQEAESTLAKKSSILNEIERDKRAREIALEELARLREKAGDPLAQVGQGASDVGRLIPGIPGEIIGGIGLLLTTVSELRRRATKNAATNALGTLSTAIAGGIIPLSDEAKALLHKTQSEAAKKLVREAQAYYGDAMTIAAAKKG